MKKVTSAYANKLLKQLNEEKSYWLQLESECCTYVVANGEEAVIPEDDYQTVAKTIEGLDGKIATIKHAINCYNVTTFLTLEDGQSMTIDQALVVMAQLNRRKQQLDYMRKLQPKQRKENSYMRSNNLIEYMYVNYDLNLVKQEFEHISEEIMEIQMKLDQLNQTIEFGIEI